MRVRQGASGLLLLLILAGVGYGAQRLGLYSWNAVVDYASPFTAPLPSETAGSPLTQRVVLVIVDGLRLDSSRSMPVLNSLREHGADFAAWTGEPSLSLPGWTAIVSGASQEVSGVTTNWYKGPVPIDHLFAAAKRTGLRTAAAGGAGWGNLFGMSIDQLMETKDLHGYVDAELLHRTSADVLRAARQMLHQGTARFVVVHFPSVDLLGHAFGGASAGYAEATRRVDAHLRDLLQELDLSTTAVVVTSDHGHIDTGGHGGWEPVVKRVPLVLAGQGVRRHARVADVRQLDVAPTVAALLGVPIPAHSQGRPLLEALDRVPEDLGPRWAAQQRAFYRIYGTVLGAPALVDFLTTERVASIARDNPDGPLALSDDLAQHVFQARMTKLARERTQRLPLALAVALLPVLYLVWHPRKWSRGIILVSAITFFLIDYALFFGRGYYFSLSVFNTESLIKPFFNLRLLDAAIAIAAASFLAGILTRGKSRGEAFMVGIDVGILVASAILVQVLYFYWLWGVRFPWYLPDLRLGFKFYLDLLALVPVGFLAVVYALLAILGRTIGRLITPTQPA